MVRQVAERIGVNPANRLAWIPAAAFLLSFAMAALGAIAFARTFGQSEGRESAELRQVLTAFEEFKRVQLQSNATILGEVSSIRGSVGTQQRQLDQLEAKITAEMDSKTREIARLEGQVREALAWAQSADKRAALAEAAAVRNGG